MSDASIVVRRQISLKSALTHPVVCMKRLYATATKPSQIATILPTTNPIFAMSTGSAKNAEYAMIAAMTMPALFLESHENGNDSIESIKTELK